MNTPNKYAFTPYASTPKGNDGTASYPSQSSDYISFHMGGQSFPTSAQKWRNDRASRGSNRGHHYYNNRNRDATPQKPQQQQQQQNVPYFYQDRTPNQQQQNNQQANRPRRFSFQRINMHKHGVHKDMVEIVDYVHASMLEDPWQSLIERHETIEACDLQLHVAKDEEEQDTTDEPSASVEQIE